MLMTNTIYILQFAEHVSSQRFNRGFATDQQLQKLYFESLVYAYLVDICSKRVSLHGTAKKLYLINEHSIKVKCSTKYLLQKYLKHHSYSKVFPSHRREAIDYYQVCFISKSFAFSLLYLFYRRDYDDMNMYFE